MSNMVTMVLETKMEIRNLMDLSRFAVSPTVSRRFTKIEMIATLAARLACVLV